MNLYEIITNKKDGGKEWKKKGLLKLPVCTRKHKSSENITMESIW